VELKEIMHYPLNQILTVWALIHKLFKSFHLRRRRRGVNNIDHYDFEEDIADVEFRKDLFDNLAEMDYESEADNKLRENLICKVKKVWDEFRLSDDTFFRTVFIYDYQERMKLPANQIRYQTMKVWLDEIFSFSENAESCEKQKQYLWFFEMIASLIVAMKFYDFELEAPSLRQVLKYFKIGKMNFTTNDDSLDSEKIKDIQEIVFETVYEYTWERQMDLWFRINWKIPMITMKVSIKAISYSNLLLL
jgi:hypothetical protein